MTASVAELKIGQLRKELADAEAAQQVKKTVASELAEADKAVNEAQRLVNISKTRLAEEVAVLEGLSKEGALIPQGLDGARAKHDVKTQRAHQSVSRTYRRTRPARRRIQQKRIRAWTDRKAKSPNTRHTSPCGKNSVGWSQKQPKLASTLFKVPLDDLSSVLRKISMLSEAENRLISDARSALRDGGLPEVKPCSLDSLRVLLRRRCSPRFQDCARRLSRRSDKSLKPRRATCCDEKLLRETTRPPALAETK